MEQNISFISRRGPDGFGRYEENNSCWKAKIFHTRLAILDLSEKGRQPMEDQESPWLLAYNGEIYNFLEIKKELTGLGWTFQSQTDTEVLLKAWTHWGPKILSRLNGMFAFAVFHKKTNELWLIRDRFGVKPLHWAISTKDGFFVFSSSLAAVARSIDADVNIDACALGLRYLLYDSNPEITSFKDVKSVHPGGWLKVVPENGKFSISSGTWYNLLHEVEKKSQQIHKNIESELLDECRECFFDAVKIRLRSDVPLAVSLSGGLDSSSVSSIAAKFKNKVHGFTYGSPFANTSEGLEVERFTNQTGITPHFIWPETNGDYLDNLLEATLIAQEAPFPGLSVMAQNEIFKNVQKAGFKVLLGGQGGDEIFAGYRKFFFVAIRHAVYSQNPFEILRLFYSLGLMLAYESFNFSTYLQNLDRYRPKAALPFKLLSWTVPRLDLFGPHKQDLALRQIQDIQKLSIPSLLRYEDRNSMAYGIESRLPFMDYRLVELAIALPARLKIQNGFGKWALREITKDIVPCFIRTNRKKRGFDVKQKWIQNGLGQKIRSRIKENAQSIKPFLKGSLNPDRDLSDSALISESNLLREALMLCWLSKPIRQPKILK